MATAEIFQIRLFSLVVFTGCMVSDEFARPTWHEDPRMHVMETGLARLDRLPEAIAVVSEVRGRPSHTGSQWPLDRERSVWHQRQPSACQGGRTAQNSVSGFLHRCFGLRNCLDGKNLTAKAGNFTTVECIRNPPGTLWDGVDTGLTKEISRKRVLKAANTGARCYSNK